MAITYPLTLPTVAGIASINLRAVNAVAVSSSPFTYKQQVIAHQGQRWEAEVTLPPMTRADAETWIAFLVSLQGARGTFTMGDPNAASARGSASVTAGTPLVNGADQTGGSSATLHKVLQDVDSNASGQATLELWPYIRTAPSDNAIITVGDTVGVFRLSSNQTDWSINNASFYGITFAAVEAVA